MAVQTVFRRYELKYLLTVEQKARVLAAMEPYMGLDRYGRTTIRNLYFDTDTYRLIRRSIDKPVYKEKLRVRSYRPAGAEEPVFVELKKKFKGVVYKRRLVLPREEAMTWLQGEADCPLSNQIGAEIDYVRWFYGGLHPTVFLSYDREAYYTREPSDFRVTFDDAIRFRQEALCLGAEVYGTPILPEGWVLMELKCSGGIPLWMTRVLTEEGLYKTSFSKYGTAYRQGIFPQLQKEARIYAGNDF